jgi:hypothetical protein
MSLPQTGSGYRVDEPTKAAKVLIKQFPSKAIELLTKGLKKDEVITELQNCCSIEGLDYHQVLASVTEPDRGDNTRSEKSHRRSTNESQDSTRPYQSRKSSSDTTATRSIKEGSGSSASLGGSMVRRIIVAQSLVEDDEKLDGSFNQTYFLIRSDIVEERLEEDIKHLSSPISFNYNDKVLQCDEAVKLTWKFAPEKKTHSNIFLLVSDLTTDIVIGKLQPKQDLLQDSVGLYS